MEHPFPAYKGDDPYVFVCYAHEDEADVYPEIEWLHEHGVNLWYDEGISEGSRTALRYTAKYPDRVTHLIL